jgi:hypothetical protein
MVKVLERLRYSYDRQKVLKCANGQELSSKALDVAREMFESALV